MEFVVEFFRKSIQYSLKECPLIHYREPQADTHLEKSWSSFLCGEVKPTIINLIFSGSLHQLIIHLTSLCTRSYEMCWGGEDKKRKTKQNQAIAKGEGSGRGKDWEFGTSRCELLHMDEHGPVI